MSAVAYLVWPRVWLLILRIALMLLITCCLLISIFLSPILFGLVKLFFVVYVVFREVLLPIVFVTRSIVALMVKIILHMAWVMVLIFLRPILILFPALLINTELIRIWLALLSFIIRLSVVIGSACIIIHFAYVHSI